MVGFKELRSRIMKEVFEVVRLFPQECSQRKALKVHCIQERIVQVGKVTPQLFGDPDVKVVLAKRKK